jgi:hypothetical protein
MSQRQKSVSNLPLYAVSFVASAVVYTAVVKGIGYTKIAGFVYFMAYFAAMALFIRVLGYSCSGSNHG